LYKSKIDEEIEKREKEKFEVLEKQVEDAQNNFNAAEKKEFERLWDFYCNSLNEIEYRQIQITEVKNEKASLNKELNRKNFILLAFTIAINAADYFFINNNDYIPLIFLITVTYFVYVQIKNDIQVTSKNIEEKIHESAVSSIRHTLSLNSMSSIKYEREYLAAFSKLHGGSTENEKENYEKYNNLHFTHVSDKLIKLTKKNLE
jgi:hypothetical protein